MLIIDFETRSPCDLKMEGAIKYCNHPETEILCVALYDLDTEESTVFDPEETGLSLNWRTKIHRADFILAHNATFDRGIYEIAVEAYIFPKIPFEKWYCTSAQMRVNAMPASLEDACLAAQVTRKKDFAGSALIKKMSIPPYEMSEQLMADMMSYCLKDVEATADIVRKTRLMTEIEHADWLVNEKINLRGVRVDRELATVAQRYAEAEQAAISDKMFDLTNGVVTKPTQHQRIKQYVLDSLDLTDENDRILEKYMTVYKGSEKKYCLDKNVRQSVITTIDAGNLNLFEDIEAIIRLLDDASASSVAKFKRMLTQSDDNDHRVRGAFVYYGASQTGRYASRGLQLHNMKRECFSADETEVNKEFMRNGFPMENVMQRLSKLLRPALIPDEGNVFVVGDWSSIEARALPWLSGDIRAQTKLDMFRAGIDVYMDAAKKMNLDDRQIGKVAELSLGYGGAVGAFTAMAKNYGLVLPEYQVKRIVQRWRISNPWAVDYWRKVENAAKKAIRSRGAKSFQAGRVVYTFLPKLLGGTLMCILPDGTAIQYPYAKIEHSDRGDNISCLKATIHAKKGESEWGRIRLWGGLMVENITQAFCAGLLRDKLREATELLDVIGHVHDEIIIESKKTFAKSNARALKITMEAVPEYAKGLPLKAEPVIMERYGKH